MYDYDYMEETLRYLLLEGGAYSQAQLGEKLGYEREYWEKKFRKVRRFLQEHLTEKAFVVEKVKRAQYAKIKLDYVEHTQALIARYYWQNHELKQKEERRLWQLVHFLADHYPHYYSLEHLVREAPVYAEVDEEQSEDSYESTLKYLAEVGVLEMVWRSEVKDGLVASPTGNRLYRFCDVLSDLTFDELVLVYRYIVFIANTRPVSFYGLHWQNMLGAYLQEVTDDFISYRNTTPVGLLNEAKRYTIAEAISANRYVSFNYFTATEVRDFKTTTAEKVELPIALVNDYQLHRSYFISHDGHTFKTYRLDQLFDVQLTEQRHDGADHETKRRDYAARSERMWLVTDAKRLQTVELSFRDTKAVRQRLRNERYEWREVEGRLYVTCDIAQPQEMMMWLRSFGANVNVLAPAGLRKQWQQSWQKVMRYYDDV